MSIQPFHIDIPQAVLQDLKERLAGTRWPDEVEGAGWDYGTNLDYLKGLVDYWQNKYDWRAQETDLNRFNQFRAKVDGTGIHFIYERGKGPAPIPIILTHGWPDSFYRFHKVIPMLTDPASYGGDPNSSFDVIVPSIPGYGFSDHKAMTEDAVADLWVKLMTEVLGYETFAAAGGDYGTLITRSLALNYPDLLIAIHLTDVGYPDSSTDFSTLSPAEQEFASFIQKWWMEEGAFNMVQSTKPQSLAYGLNDSPVGLAAWILSFMNARASIDIEERFTRDELLTNIMIYWVTETINSSIRVYYEMAHAMPSPDRGKRSSVPAAVAHMPLDAPLPREWAERNVNLKHFTEMPLGGHFAAWEVPELYAKDLQEFFGGFRK
ncbi:alpha/beta fold hydrolase [Methanosarcina sp. DH2]|uniref:epoxide hydrolase family protein n=1 Tax=Methanosarcina sp. DH2 TaxID=2605639 RepID=UPI001E50DC6F|nr:epoxide hydrolase family protein [Methanosarcina sp. DH2]MCC4769135.1 alpha/beta fold hydrolase [Methanosarcina sp. DH2]